MNDLADRRLEEKERRRADILDAAEAVAGAVGCNELTMDQVARKARLSRALLYVYFQDKTDLLFGLCERGLGILRRRFGEAAARHARGIDQIEAIGRAYVGFSAEFPVYYEALSCFEAHTPEGLAGVGNEGACVVAGDECMRAMVESISAGIRDGSIRADVGPPMMVAMTLWGFTHGALQLAGNKRDLLARDGIDPADFVAHALTMARWALVPVG
jgi:AcrR family transcriptional regulator